MIATYSDHECEYLGSEGAVPLIQYWRDKKTGDIAVVSFKVTPHRVCRYAWPIDKEFEIGKFQFDTITITEEES